MELRLIAGPLAASSLNYSEGDHYFLETQNVIKLIKFSSKLSRVLEEQNHVFILFC